MEKVTAYKKTVPYLIWKNIDSQSDDNVVELSYDTSIDNLFLNLENGANLFRLVPNLDKNAFLKYPFKAAIFATCVELSLDGVNYESKNGYVVSGKLLIPESRVRYRGDLKFLADNAHDPHDRIAMLRILNSGHQRYYKTEGKGYIPVLESEVLVLKMDQLK